MSKLLKRYDLILTVALFSLVIPLERMDWLGVVSTVENELRGYRQMLRWSRANPSQTAFRADDVVMVVIDDAFYDAYGQHPLRRRDHGVLARNLGQLGARVVVIDAPMDRPSPRGEDAATARLYAQTRNVLLVSTVDLDIGGHAALDITYPVPALRGSTRSGYVERVESPAAMRLRIFPQMIGREDGWPLAVQAVALYRQVTPRVEHGVLHIGEFEVPLDHGTDIYVDFPRLPDGTRFLSDTFSVPAIEILKLMELPPDDVVRLTFAIRDKIVLVGDVSSIVEDAFDTPAGRAYGVEMIAAGIHTLLNGAPLRAAPVWAQALVGLALLVLLLGTSWVRPHLLRLPLGLVILGGYVVAVALAHAELGLILPLTGNLVAGIIGAFLINLRLWLGPARPSAGEREFQTVRSAALALQGQGRLDQAFEKFREMALNDTVADLIYNLGLDYERKRLFGRAVNVYRYLAEEWDENYRDIGARILKAVRVEADPRKEARSLEPTMAPGGEVKTFGRFQVIEELEGGASGAVYRGLDPETKREVTVKTMPLSRAVLHEAKLAAGLDHPHIVAVHDCGAQDDLAYLVMEQTRGHDLRRHTLKGSLLALDVVLEIMTQCAEALHHAHTNGVVHRDIEPSNIIYEPESGNAKITDFALGHVAETGARSSVRAKPNYMSPEEAAGGAADGRSDLFSLGVVLYQLCCGELPFQGDSMSSLRYKIVNQSPPDIITIDSRVPATVRKVLDNALRKDPRRRYPSGAKLAEHLRLCKQRLQAARKSA